MRIGLDVHVLSGQHQGTVTVWTSLLQHLPPRHTYVLYSFDPEATRRTFPGAHFEHRRIPIRNSWLRILIAYPWLARRDRCAIFHVNYYGPPVGIRGLVVTVQDLLYLDLPGPLVPRSRRWISRTLGKLTARRARQPIVGSEYTARRVAHHLGVPRPRVAVVLNALADEWFAPDENAIAAAWMSVGPRLPARYALAIGRWEPRKNHVMAAEVARRLQREGLLDGLVIVGPEDFGAASVRRELRERGLQGVVTSLSGLELPALQAVYRHAAVLLFPSEGEGFGYPVVEALAMGTPVIASDRGAIPEVCGDAGLIVHELDADALAATAAMLLRDPVLQETLRVRGRLQVWRFTGREYADRIARIYDAVGAR